MLVLVDIVFGEIVVDGFYVVLGVVVFVEW